MRSRHARTLSPPRPTFEREERVGALSLAVVTGHVERRVALGVEKVGVYVVVHQVTLQKLRVAPHCSGREVLRGAVFLYLALTLGAHISCGLGTLT